MSEPIKFKYRGMNGQVFGIYVKWGGVGFHVDAAPPEMKAAIKAASLSAALLSSKENKQ